MDHFILFWLLLVVDGVFADDVKSVSVSVMVGDCVTLNTNDTETQGAEALRWKFQSEKKFIAQIDKETNTSSVPGNNEDRFRGRLELNDETGSLTITNLNTTDSGVYELHVKKTQSKFTRFNVTVRDELKTVSVKVGDFVILRTGLTEISGYDLTWRSKEHLMAEINRAAHQSSVYGSANGTSDDRLQLHPQTGSLIISDIKTTDSGDYYLNMSSSSHTIQRTIRVNVKESGLSPGAVAGIVVALSVLLVIAVVAVYYCHK